MSTLIPILFIVYIIQICLVYYLKDIYIDRKELIIDLIPFSFYIGLIVGFLQFVTKNFRKI